MAVPPTYSDLGKAAKDIFSKGYGEYTFRPNSKLLTSRNSRVTESFQICCFRKNTEVTSVKLALTELIVQGTDGI